MTDRSPHNIVPQYCHGYWHGRNGFDRCASEAEYLRGWRDGCNAAAQAPKPPHSENEDLQTEPKPH